MDVLQIARRERGGLIELRRSFHAHPELSGQEFETSRRIKETLDRLDIPWRPCGLETGVLAEISGAKPGRTILLRADMDALTVQEETGLPYASTVPGVMHACGHDCHMAALLAAAQILKGLQGELCGTVRLAFQPAEETAKGAQSMIEQGALDGVDGCFALHVWGDIETGKVVVNDGAQMGAADMFEIDITGKGGHGASPHQGIDAAIVACAMVNNLQTLVSREIAPWDPAVLTVGRMDVGTRCNVIPEKGHLEGTTRYFSRELGQRFPEIMERVVTQTAKTFRASATLNYMRVMPPAINNGAMSGLVRRSVEKLFGPGGVGTSEPSSGGEDFAYFMERVPGVLAFVGMYNPACGAVWPNHSGRFLVDEEALVQCAALYVQTALDFNCMV